MVEKTPSNCIKKKPCSGLGDDLNVTRESEEKREIPSLSKSVFKKMEDRRKEIG
jgi:hypothetical protein